MLLTPRRPVSRQSGENMVAFFTSQLDFIYFFYGLAFILLGATCWAIARSSVARNA